MMPVLFLLLSMTFFGLLHGEGFIGGTLVSTPSGYECIETLKQIEVVDNKVESLEL